MLDAGVVEGLEVGGERGEDFGGEELLVIFIIAIVQGLYSQKQNMVDKWEDGCLGSQLIFGVLYVHR